MNNNAGERSRQWVRPDIQRMSRYAVMNANDMVKLDAMENPYQLPEALRREWLERLSDIPWNRYPDAGCEDLRERLSETIGLPPDCRLVIGNGSDELIQAILLSVGGEGRNILAPVPGFVMYEVLSKVTGSRFTGIPLKADFELDGEAMLSAIRNLDPACVFLAWPNNPTGNVFSQDVVIRIIESTRGLVVIDEAYEPFCGESFLGRLGEWPNVVVMRTLSKMGLAGLRIGYVAGDPSWLDEFDKVRLPYNVNVLSQSAALFALEHHVFFENSAARIRDERSHLFDELSKRDTLQVFPSRANFILFRCLGLSASGLFNQLRNRGVLVKNLDGADPALAGCLRVTVGTPEESAVFLDALDAGIVALASAAE